MRKKKFTKRLLVLFLAFAMTVTSVDFGFFTSYATETASEESVTIMESEEFYEAETAETEVIIETTEELREKSTEELTEESTEESSGAEETCEPAEPEGEASTELEAGEQTDSLLEMFAVEPRATQFVGTYSHSVIHSSVGSSTLGWTGRIQHWKIEGTPAICIQKGVSTPPVGTEYNRYDAANLPEDVRKAVTWYESSNKGVLATLAAQYFVWAVIDGKDPNKVVVEAVTDYYTKIDDEEGLSWAPDIAQSYIAAIKRSAPATCFEWRLPGCQTLITSTDTPGHPPKNPPTEPPTEPPTDPTPTQPEEIQPVYDTVSASASYSTKRTHSVSIDSKYAAITGESLKGAVFEVLEDGVSKGTITTDANGRGSLSWEIIAAGNVSAERTYCSNYDQLSESMKAEVSGFTNREEAYNAAFAEADAGARAQSEANAKAPHTVTVKEIHIPEGFSRTAESEQSTTLAGNADKVFRVKNKPWKAKFTLDKVDGISGSRLTKDAEFVLYEWNGSEYSLSPNYRIVRLSDGSYTVQSNYSEAEPGYVYYTQVNEGKFGVGEVSAPDGYIKEDAIFYFRITEDNQIVKAHNAQPENYAICDDSKWANQPAHVFIRIPKTDRYSGNKIAADAEFVVYAKEGEVSAPVIFTKQPDGSYLSNEVYYADTFDNANYGLFYMVEQTAPEGYYGDWADENADKTAGSEENKVVYEFAVFGDLSNHDSVITFTNDEAGNEFWNEHQYGSVDLYKYDDEAEADYEDGSRVTQGDTITLDGAVYGLYANENIYHPDGVTGLLYSKDELVATATIGRTPVTDAFGYLLDTEGTRCIESGKEPAFTITLGATGFRQVELGSYYISEITPPDGYLPDTTIHRGEELKKYYVTFEYAGESKAVTVRRETAKEDGNNLTMDDEIDSSDIYSGDFVCKQAAQFIKLEDTNTDDEKDPVVAGFSIYRIQTLAGVMSGSIAPAGDVWTRDDMMKFEAYDFTTEKTALLYKRDSETWTAADKAWLVPTGERANEYRVGEMFSDENGYFCTPELPVGQYVLVETTVPEGKKMANPVLVTITKDSAVPQAMRYIGDETTETYIRIQKKDSDCTDDEYNTVLKPGAEYRIRLLGDGREFDTEIWKIDEDGYLWYYNPTLDVQEGTETHPFAVKCIYKEGKIIDAYIEFDQLLPVGEYEITEVGVPDGYVKNGCEETAVDTSDETENSYEIRKNPWKKVTFEISNDVVYPEGQIGENKYVNTDEYGRLVITVTQENKEQKGILEITKLGEQLYDADLDTVLVFDYELAPVGGAVFEIYAAEDIYTQQLDKFLLEQYADDVSCYLAYQKDERIGTVTTDESGFAYKDNLYIGKYYIKEVIAGGGFVRNPYMEEFEITPAEPEVNFIVCESTYNNERQKADVSVVKRDANTGKTLSGAVFGLYNKKEIVSYIRQDADGNYCADNTGRKLLKAETLIAKAVTGKNGTAHFEADLPLGEYYVKELSAPNGYHISEEIIEIDASYQGQEVKQLELSYDFYNKPDKPKPPTTPKETEPAPEIPPEVPAAPQETIENPPQTGDLNQLLYVTTAAFVSLLAFLLLAAWLERRKE